MSTFWAGSCSSRVKILLGHTNIGTPRGISAGDIDDALTLSGRTETWNVTAP